MRENRTYGSEGGEGESPSLPLSALDHALMLFIAIATANFLDSRRSRE